MKLPKFTESRVVADRNPHNRRSFLRKSGLGLAAAGLFLAGCEDDDDPIMIDETVNLGSGDVGVLNYAYALEQLEAAFYAQVLQGGYFASASAEEKQIMTDLEAHERAHAEFFEAAISSVATAIPALGVDFSSIDFDSRSSVLGTAQAFEDLGVSAYNGAGRLLQNPDFLVIAGKIVSVEARHAAAIRSINSASPRAFASSEVVDSNGLDLARTPSQVLNIAKTFITTNIDASGLPQ
ncbi:ferritin-like domain-containing protein [Neolewinella litorea]|uniref:Ferritin-like domain-containing protein n=1 Tax=Neolewinella litorea TaxID=2562452 RepID=A0A4S4NQI1_9BACT|nr:ferritin-like domain-containing protein [Neolewinella litorea]THH41417.1 ferritin-like domain-containing protein [Neolewinella litorea]